MALPVVQQSNQLTTKPQTGIQLFKGSQLTGNDLDLLYQTYYNTYSKTPAMLSSPDQGNALVKSTTSTVDNPLVKAGDKRKLTPKSASWFKNRGVNWIFFGNQDGYVAVRKQSSGAYKLITVAGDKKVMLEALKELLSKKWPVWGAVSDTIARILQNPALGSLKFYQLNADLTTLLYNENSGLITQGSPSVVKALFGSPTLTDEGNGYITVIDEELGTPFAKVVVGNAEWLKLTMKLGSEKGWPNDVLMKLKSILSGSYISSPGTAQITGSVATPKMIGERYVPIDRKKLEESLFNRGIIHGTKEVISKKFMGENDIHIVSESIARNIKIGFLSNLKEKGKTAKQSELDAFLDMVCEHLQGLKGKKDSKFLESKQELKEFKIPASVDFSKIYVNGKKEFRVGSEEYDILSDMEELEWDNYTTKMEASGVTVEYDPRRDTYTILN